MSAKNNNNKWYVFDHDPLPKHVFDYIQNAEWYT